MAFVYVFLAEALDEEVKLGTGNEEEHTKEGVMRNTQWDTQEVEQILQNI
jgi:hypothetical protein